MEKVSAMKKVALFFMTQRVARPMKFAAFISIIISVAVMLAACQGAVGPKGDKGESGEPGETATPTSGLPGTAALQALSIVAPTLLNDDELVDDEGRKVSAAEGASADDETKTFTVDLSAYFIGGTPDYKYAFVDMDDDEAGVQNALQGDAADAVIDGEINNDTGMLEYTLTISDSPSSWAANLYTIGFVDDVTVTDHLGVEATATVTIMLNKEPTFDDGGTGVVNDGSGITLVLGTMAGKRKDADGEDGALGAVENVHMECAEINECVLDVFGDDGDITVTVTGMTRDEKPDSGHVDWAPTDDGNVKLIGLASTWDADATPAADSPITVKLKAVDGRGLEAEASVLVSVNAAPTLSELGQSFVGSSHAVDKMLTLTNEVSAWFMNAEGGDTLAFTGESDNANIASIDDDDTTAALTDGDVDITGVTLGRSTTITITATENAGLRQSASLEFTVSVTGVEAAGN